MSNKHQYEILSKISFSIKENHKEEKNVGVLVGKMGLSFFQFHYSKLINSSPIFNHAMELVEECVQIINQENNISSSYCTGIAGFGWGLDFLDKYGFLKTDSDSFLNEIDALMETKMLLELNYENYDFFNGAIGYGFYFFQRLQNTKSQSLKKYYIMVLNQFLKKIAEIAIIDESLWKWRKLGSKNQSKENSYDLGLSHGVSSILNFIASLGQLSEFRTKTLPILRGGVNFVLGSRNEVDNYCYFPNKVNGYTSNKMSRLAWCYGDLGIGYALLKCSKVLRDKSLYKFAYKVLDHASKRRSINQTMIKDAAICHGSFGNMMIFRYLHESIGNQDFKDAYDFWYSDGLNKSIHSSGYGGFKSYWEGSNVWKNELSLLEGVAGIGLGIIDGLSNKTNHWSKSLMIG